MTTPDRPPSEKRGTYIRIFFQPRQQVRCVGSLGKVRIKKGWYAYVGSALGKRGFHHRVGRHMMRKKKQRWHVDFLGLLVREVWIKDSPESDECLFAQALSSFSGHVVNGFGSSDCKCPAHLFYFRSAARLLEARKGLCHHLGLICRKTALSFNTKDETPPVPVVRELLIRS